MRRGRPVERRGSSEHQLIGFDGWIGRVETRIALNLEAAYHIQNGDQKDLSDSRHVHMALRIEFPLVMWCAFRLDRWTGQITVFLIATRELLGFEQRRNSRAAGQGVM